MFGHWYNSSLRRYIVLMGDLFSHISVARMRDNKVNYIKVPITYKSKERFVQVLNKYTNPSSQENIAKVETVLPRMNLNLVDMMYNSGYKTSQANRTMSRDNGIRTYSQYAPTAFKMIFELGIYTRNQDDMFQIVEQILPYFQPHFNTTITEMHTNPIKQFDRDIRIAFQSVAIDETPDGDVNTRRHIEWSIMFEVNGWIYPPVADIKGEIKTVYVNFFNEKVELTPEGEFEDLEEFESVDHQVVPKDVQEADWDGESVTTYSRNKPIPVDPDAPKPR